MLPAEKYSKGSAKEATNRLKVRGWGKMYLATTNQQKAAVAVLAPDKVGFVSKSISRHIEVHHQDKGVSSSGHKC